MPHPDFVELSDFTYNKIQDVSIDEYNHNCHFFPCVATQNVMFPDELLDLFVLYNIAVVAASSEVTCFTNVFIRANFAPPFGNRLSNLALTTISLKFLDL